MNGALNSKLYSDLHLGMLHEAVSCLYSCWRTGAALRRDRLRRLVCIASGSRRPRALLRRRLRSGAKRGNEEEKRSPLCVAAPVMLDRRRRENVGLALLAWLSGWAVVENPRTGHGAEAPLHVEGKESPDARGRAVR